jgi:antirestriction protein ArdC
MDKQAERQAKVKEAQELLASAVASLVTDEDWKHYLEFQAFQGKFHKYSANNYMLILMQCPHASLVAGYNKWQELGRQVRKGEKGIRILAPMVFKRTETDSNGDETESKRIWFKVVSVFDISQTDGEPVPFPSAMPGAPVLLDGEAPEGLYDGLAALVAAQGYTLERGDCQGANGYTDFMGKRVRVRDDVSAAQACKTLAHELAHILLDHKTREITRDRCEVEAESVAYIVGRLHGLDSTGYSLPYVAHWADGSAEKVKETADKVTKIAEQILAVLESKEDALADAA